MLRYNKSTDTDGNYTLLQFPVIAYGTMNRRLIEALDSADSLVSSDGLAERLSLLEHELSQSQLKFHHCLKNDSA